MASKRIQGITIEIGADATPLNKAIKSANAAINKTQSGLRDVNKLLKMDPSSTVLLTQKQKALSDAINQTKDKLKTLKDAADKANDALKSGEMTQEQYDALQREIIETEQNLKQLEQQARQSASVLGTQFQEAGRKIQEAGEKISAFGEKISAMGGQLTMKVTAPIVAAAGVAVTKFAEVDKSMTLANATMKNTSEEAEMLNKAMEDAASASIFGMSDAANATLNFARAGLNAEQAAAALAPSMNLAAAYAGDLNVVSAGLVATINGFQDSFENTAHYADVFSAACGNSALEIDDMSQAMSVAAPVFKAAGYNIEDAALYMGVMANNGIDANTAANALKTGMAKLAKPAKEGAEALDALGVELFNADGSMKDSLEVQKLLHDSFATLSDQEQIAAASAIFGKNQMSNWLALINTAPGDVDNLSSSLEDCAGTTQEMSDAMMSGFAGSIEELKSKLDVLMTSLGKLVAKYLTPVIEKISECVDKFQNLSDAEKDQIVRIAGIVAAVGPALLIAGKIITTISKIVTGFGNITSAVGKCITKITAMAATNPIMLAIGVAVAAAAAAFAVMAIRTKEAHDRAAELSDEQQNLHDKLMSTNDEINRQTESYKTALAQVDQEISSEQRLIDELNGITDANGRVRAGYEERAQVIAGQLAEAFGVEIEYQNGVIQKYDEVMAKIDEVIAKKKAEALLSAGQQDYINALNGQAQAYRDVKDTEDGLKVAQDALTAAQDQYTQSVNNLSQAQLNAATAGDGLGRALAMNKFAEAQIEVREAAAAVQGASEKVNTLSADLDNANRAWENTQATLTNYEALQEAVASGTGDLDHLITTFSNNLLTSGNATKEQLVQQAQDAEAFFQQVQADYYNSDKAISESALQSAREMRDAAIEELKKTSEDSEESGKNITAGVSTGMKDPSELAKIEQAGGEIGDAATNSVDTKMGIESPSKVMQERGHYIVDGLVLGIRDKIPEIQTVGQEVKDALMQAFSGDQQIGMQTGTAAMTGKGGKGGVAGNNQQAGFFSTLLTQFDMMLTLFEEKNIALQEQITTWLEEFTTLETTWFDETWFMNIQDQCQQVEDKLTEHVENLKTLQTDTWTEAQTATDTNFGLLYSTTETKLDEIYNKFDEVMTKLKTDAVTWGEDIVQGLIDGIDNMMPTLQAKCEAVAAMIASYIHFSLPDKGPLSDMDESMPDMINMMVRGIDENLPKLAAANERMAQTLAPDMSGMTAMNRSTSGTNSRLDALTDVVARYLPLAAQDRQVVLYPNKLVGAIAPDMNRALGGMMA
jgi:TP901 family phage tail tape measure protein